MKTEEVIFKAPPRLLLGVAFLFWGAMLESPVLGLVAALLMEARHWTTLRWKFGELGFARAWQLSVLVLIVSAVVKMGSEDDRVSSSMGVLSMLPLMFLPLMLAQQYASDRGVPLTTFSFIARRKMARERAAGKEVRLTPLQLGYPYLGIILTTAGLGVEEVKWYGIGIIVLVGACLRTMKGDGKVLQRPVAWSAAFALAVIMALGIAGGTYWAYGKFTQAIKDTLSGDARETRTALGQVEELKLSPAIDWRYFHEAGSRPARLRLSSYNTFVDNRWTKMVSGSVQRPIADERKEGYGIARLYESDDGERANHAYRKEDLNYVPEYQGILRGSVSDEALLPLPAGSRRFVEVAADSLNVNGLGTTKISDPDRGTIALRIEGGAERVCEEDPSEFDLIIRDNEEPGMTEFWKEHGLDLPVWLGPSDDEEALEDMPQIKDLKFDPDREMKVWVMLQAALKDYRYTLDLNPEKGEPPITHFLDTMKKGHCEYFASATTLLLRRAGIPARYAVGYAIEEMGKTEGEWILRGKHAHAWCQAYLGGRWQLEPSANGVGESVWRCRGGKWVDIDLTPADWLIRDRPEDTWAQAFKDWWQLLVEDLIIWFGKPSVVTFLKIAVWTLGLSLVALVVYRLWSSKTRKAKPGKGSWEDRCGGEKALRDLEKWLTRLVGPRPAGMPMGAWLEAEYPEESAALVQHYQEVKFDPAKESESLISEIVRFKKSLQR